jgi:hypothetical protein
MRTEVYSAKSIYKVLRYANNNASLPIRRSACDRNNAGTKGFLAFINESF